MEYKSNTPMLVEQSNPPSPMIPPLPPLVICLMKILSPEKNKKHPRIQWSQWNVEFPDQKPFFRRRCLIFGGWDYFALLLIKKGNGNPWWLHQTGLVMLFPGQGHAPPVTCCLWPNSLIVLGARSCTSCPVRNCEVSFISRTFHGCVHGRYI